jgi:hypothetical protein
MRRATRLVAVLVAAAALLAVPVSAAGAATHVSGKARELAREVCEDMVGDAVVAAADQPLRAPQRGTWTESRYTCAYDFADGRLTLSVDVYRNVKTARRAFAGARTMLRDGSRLFGIGQEAVQGRSSNMVVARKDNFLLVVDPTALGPGINRDATAWSATRAVFDCW